MVTRTRIVLLLLFHVCSMSATYAAWGLHRSRGSVWYADRANYPRPLPYPDTVLISLNDWYDQRLPVPPGHIKWHSEWGRVVATLWVWFDVFALLSLLWLWLLVAPWAFRYTGYL